MEDITWIMREQVDMYVNDKTTYANALNGILNALALSESDAIKQYIFAKSAITTVCSENEDKGKLICKMIDKIIEDEGNHNASLMTSAAVCIGINKPVPMEYNESVKEYDE